MISITCTQCKTVLEMDEAFAGGVCRCRHCGTIQTVPSSLKGTSTSGGDAAAESIGGSRSLYAGAGGAATEANAGTHLNGTADAVSGSGMNSAAAGAGGDFAAGGALPSKSAKPFIIGGAVLLILLLALGGWFMLHNKGGGKDGGGGGEPLGPSFVGLKLNVPSVVYVLDRGNATTNYFDAIKAATYRSLQLLGPSKKFAVILTDNQTEDAMFPKQGMHDATAGELENLKEVLQDVVATGNSRFGPALDKAIALHPASIVIITAKYPLDDEDIAALAEAQKKGVTINTFAIGDIANPPLEALSTATGGAYRQISDHDLRTFAVEP